MEILDTLVSREIALIDSLPQQQVAHRWRLLIKANGVEIEPFYIKEIKLDRLYHKNYGDELRITVGLNWADMQYNILPYRDALEATLIKIPLHTSTEPVENKAKAAVSNHYKVQLLNGNSDTIQGDHPLSLNKDLAGRVSIIDVTMQLFNPVIDRIRKSSYGTTFRDTSPVEAIAYVLVKAGKGKGLDAANVVKGINIDPTFVFNPRKHIPVPDRLLIAEIPAHIDEIVGGVHPAQMRYYLQAQFWYMYPIFDNQRFSQSANCLTVIKIPSTRMPGLEKTWRLADKQLIILSTRATTHQDNSEAAQLNGGNGTRYVDARNIVENYVTTGSNKAVVAIKDHLVEAVNGYRKDESDFIKSPDGTSITDKYNKEYAKMAYKAGAYIQTIWENANPDLIIPGMPVRYIFQNGEKTEEIYGTVNAVETLDYNTNNTTTDPRFTTMALLTLFISRVSPMRSETTAPTVTTTKST